MSFGEERCVLCGKICLDGIRLHGKVICSTCEEKLVSSSVDEPDYESYMHKIRSVVEHDLPVAKSTIYH